MKIGIQPLGAHLGDLLHLAVRDVVQESSQVRSGVQTFQLLLVQSHHFVHPSFVLQLQYEKLHKYRIPKDSFSVFNKSEYSSALSGLLIVQVSFIVRRLSITVYDQFSVYGF